MPKNDQDIVVTQSVLDRIRDDDPRNQVEVPMTRAQSVRALRASVRRDLEWLLNTRRLHLLEEDQYAELSRSVFFYGLPDFSAYSMNSPKDRARLLRGLEQTISVFEPRLTHVRVVEVESPNLMSDRMLHFQIEAMLKMDPAPERISFDTVLQLTSGEYSVKGEQSA